jgi:hypothetical protein
VNKVVKAFPAYETETVRIVWMLKDGTQFNQEYSCPPLEVRKARENDSQRVSLPSPEHEG